MNLPAIKIGPATTVASLLIVYPPIISVIMKLTGISLPSYVLILALGVFLFAAGFRYRLYRNGPDLTAGWIYFAYFSLCVLSLLYTPADTAAAQKIGNVIYVIGLPLVLIIGVLRIQSASPDQFYRRLETAITRHVFVCAGLFGVLFILFRKEESPGRFILPGIENPIWVARYFGFLLVAALYAFMQAEGREDKLRKGCVCLLLFGALFISGSKTPFFAVLIIFGLMLHSYGVPLLQLIRAGLVVAALIAVFAIVGSGSYVLDTDFFSVFYRLEAFGHVIASESVFLGNGVASYGPLIFNEDAEAYPHNMYLEAYFELGLLGLALMLLFTRKLFKSYDGRLIDFLGIYFFINANISGDIAGNATFFTIAYIAIMTSDKHRRLAESHPIRI